MYLRVKKRWPLQGHCKVLINHKWCDLVELRGDVISMRIFCIQFNQTNSRSDTTAKGNIFGLIFQVVPRVFFRVRVTMRENNRSYKFNGIQKFCLCFFLFVREKYANFKPQKPSSLVFIFCMNVKKAHQTAYQKGVGTYRSWFYTLNVTTLFSI